MGAEIAINSRTPAHEDRASWADGLQVTLGRMAGVLFVLLLVWLAWQVRINEAYTSNSTFAYYLGLVGGSFMLALLLYPLRKRIRFLQHLGPLRFWFRFHMFAGMAGPILVLFHSTFHVRSINAMVALGSMLLVASSGIVGRYLYRRIHRGLYGCRTNQEELQQVLEKRLREVMSSMEIPIEVKAEIKNYAQLVSEIPTGRIRRLLHVASLGMRRTIAARNTHRMMARQAKMANTVLHGKLADLHDLLLNIDEALKAVQTTAQFSTYERLFAQWHAVHIPFLFMLVITAIVHVVAVHAY